MRSRIENDNKGFSLVELIVVVLILGIMSGGAVIAMSTVMSARVSSASTMVTNLMKQARQKAMSIANSENTTDNTTDIYVEFYKNGKDIYGSVKRHTEYEEIELLNEKICNDYVEISFVNHETNATWKVGTIADGNGHYPIKVYFKKKTGGISQIVKCQAIGDEEIVCDTIVVDKPSSDDDKDTKKIVIVKGTGRVYEDD